MRSIKALVKSLILPLAVGGLASLFIGENVAQYGVLLRPPLSPPSWVFPVVWTILYLLMGFSAYLIGQSDAPTEEKRKAYQLYALQLLLNFLWPILFFNLQAYLLAFGCLLLLVGVVLLMIWQFEQIQPRAARLQLPYLLWLLFAAYLNFGVFLLNM